LGPVDVAIVGGGIAGMWLLNLLHHRGYRVVLFEAEAVGCQQTLGSQGMVHGGLKYALGGSLNRASEAIAHMPARWRDCLAGVGEVDLSGLVPLSERYYLFAEGNSLGKLTSFFASRLLRGRIEKLHAASLPASLERFDGVVYGLSDFVLDTTALLARLQVPVADRIYRHRIEADQLHQGPAGWQIGLHDTTLLARQLILAAGAGNGSLITGLGMAEPAMQLRPLHQVIVRHPDLQPLYAHCLTGITRSEPRLTITSHPDLRSAPNRWLWYLGGQLATEGVTRQSMAQEEHARKELRRCVPWIDWQNAEFDSLRLDRAEPARAGRQRPDEAFVAAADRCLVCWPTKLSLAPDLGDRVLAALAPAGPCGPDLPLLLPHARLGKVPWAG